MNSLSWFIYLTQIVDNLGSAATIVMIAGVLIGAIATPVGLAVVDDLDIPPAAIRKIVRSYLTVMVLATLVAVFTPDRRTMLLIAGSEIGERASKSQAAQDIINPGMDLLKTWIQKETEKLKKPSKD